MSFRSPWISDRRVASKAISLTLSLMPFEQILEVATGRVIGQMVERHRPKEFTAFLEHVDRCNDAGPDTEVHVILNILSSNKSPEVHEWLKDDPRRHFHFTPTSAS